MLKRVCLDFDRRVVCGQVTVPEVADGEQPSAIDRAAIKLAEKFGITEYPSVVLSPDPGHRLQTGQPAYEWRRFDGGAPSVASLSHWLDRAAPRVPVPHVRSNADWEAHCTAKGGVCVLMVLDAKGDREQLRVAGEVAARSLLSSQATSAQMDVARLPVSYLMLRDADQPDLVSTLAVGATPTAVVVNMRKKRYTVHDGPFDAAALARFVLDGVNGRTELAEFAAFPAIRTVQTRRKKGPAKAGAPKKRAFKKDEL